jgi:hypothetical protein
MKQLYMVVKWNSVYQDNTYWIFTDRASADACTKHSVIGDDFPVGVATSISKAQAQIFGLLPAANSVVVPFTVTP